MITLGPRLVYGVPDERLPLELPEGARRGRLRLRASEFATVSFILEGRFHHHYVKVEEYWGAEIWRVGHEIGSRVPLADGVASPKPQRKRALTL